jgi:hypothetical protein
MDDALPRIAEIEQPYSSLRCARSHRLQQVLGRLIESKGAVRTAGNAVIGRRERQFWISHGAAAAGQRCEGGPCDQIMQHVTVNMKQRAGLPEIGDNMRGPYLLEQGTSSMHQALVLLHG